MLVERVTVSVTSNIYKFLVASWLSLARTGVNSSISIEQHLSFISVVTEFIKFNDTEAFSCLKMNADTNFRFDQTLFNLAN